MLYAFFVRFLNKNFAHPQQSKCHYTHSYLWQYTHFALSRYFGITFKFKLIIISINIINVCLKTHHWSLNILRIFLHFFKMNRNTNIVYAICCVIRIHLGQGAKCNGCDIIETIHKNHNRSARNSNKQKFSFRQQTSTKKNMYIPLIESERVKLEWNTLYLAYAHFKTKLLSWSTVVVNEVSRSQASGVFDSVYTIVCSYIFFFVFHFPFWRISFVGCMCVYTRVVNQTVL